MSPVPSCPRHGPVHDPHDATCPALIPRVIAGDLEIVRCALPLEAHEVELVLANAIVTFTRSRIACGVGSACS